MQYTKHEDGSYTFTGGGGSFTVSNLEKQAEQSKVDKSSAAARITHLRSQRGGAIEPLLVEGEYWYLLKMGLPKTNEVAMRASATGASTSLVRNNEDFTALMLAVLQVGVVQGPKDPTPYFNPHPYLQEDAFGNMVETTEVEQLCGEPEFAETMATLFNRLTDMNPMTFPQKKMVIASLTKQAGENSTSTSTDAAGGPSSPPPASGS